MRQGGERCGGSEAASRAAKRREVRRTGGGAHRPPRGERGGAGKAAVGNGARAPSPPPVRTSRPRRASPSRPPPQLSFPVTPSRPPPQLSFPVTPSRPRRNSPSHSPSISPPPHLSLPSLSLPCRRAHAGAAAGKKPNAPRRFWRRGGSRTALEGRGGSLGTAGFLWARGLAQAAAGRTGRQKGTKSPFFPAFGQKSSAKYCNFRPRVLY